jgi:hypothetical protein
MFKRWFNRITPFVIIAVVTSLFVLFQIIFGYATLDAWKYPILWKLLLFLLATIIIDVLLKYTIKKKNYWIWIIESFLCLVLVYYWIVS